MSETWVSDCGSVELHCADCLEILPAVEARVACVITDPPYGIGYSHGGSSGVLARTTRFVGFKVIGDNRPFDPSPWLRWPCVLWGANHFCDALPRGRRWLVWDKRDGLPSNDLSDCEMAFTSLEGTARLYSCRWQGMLKDAERGQPRIHPMQKPVAIMDWCLGFFGGAAGGVVFDPYMGSGTTGVACVRMGRPFIGCELCPEFFQKAKRRIQDELRRMKFLGGGYG